jgi:hypothetical protein
VIVDFEADDGGTSHIADIPSEDTDARVNLEDPGDENIVRETTGIRTMEDDHLP